MKPDYSIPRRTVGLPPAAAGQRIGLLGGTFDPAHEGHVLISRIARRRLYLDQVWWLVTPGNPLKTTPRQVSTRERVTGAQLLASPLGFVVSDFEERLGSHYTVDTLRYLRNVRPDVQFVWIMGADSLSSFHRWKSWRAIFDLMPIAVVDRPGYTLKALASPAARAFGRHRVPDMQLRHLPEMRAPVWAFLRGPLSAQSSTKIRSRTA